MEKRITDEFHKIFDDTDSFYYCLDGDITNNLQRRQDQEQDDRFFWNKHMLKDIFQLGDESWILPVIQGFVQLEQCVIGNECFTLALVSRRSRYRAGTRYAFVRARNYRLLIRHRLGTNGEVSMRTVIG